jgi:hypothetical protein
MGNKNGYTLLVAILILGIIMVVSGALASIVQGSLRISKGIDDAMVAFYAAESGVEESLSRLARTLPPCENMSTGDSHSLTIPGLDFTRKCEVITGSTPSQYIIRSTGRFRGSNMALQVKI